MNQQIASRLGWKVEYKAFGPAQVVLWVNPASVRPEDIGWLDRGYVIGIVAQCTSQEAQQAALRLLGEFQWSEDIRIVSDLIFERRIEKVEEK